MTDTNPFWQFSIRFYSRAEVARCCLTLQESVGVDVNILLFCLWRACSGECLAGAELARLDAEVAAWRGDVVHPLRRLRQDLREYPGIESTRDLLKKAELESERVQQQVMWQWQQARRDCPGDTTKDCAEVLPGSLAAYAGLLGIEPRVFEAVEALAIEFVAESA